MDAMIGFITLNNINKSYEMLMVYLVIACACILVLTYFNRKYQHATFIQTGRQASGEIVPFAVHSLAWIFQKKSIVIGERHVRAVVLVFIT